MRIKDTIDVATCAHCGLPALVTISYEDVGLRDGQFVIEVAADVARLCECEDDDECMN